MKQLNRKVLMVCTLALLLSATNGMVGVVNACDNCSAANSIDEVTDMPFDTSTATFDGPGYFMNGPNVWCVYVPTCSGIATVDLCKSSYDTKVAVYDGYKCPPLEDDLIAYNDDYYRCEVGNNLQSLVTFHAIAGNQYLIEIGGHQQDVGEGLLTITCEQAICPPINDSCYNAEPVGDIFQLPFDTRCATFDGLGIYMTGPNIWYIYTASCNGVATVSLCGSDFDTKLAAYDWDGCPPAAQDLISSNDDFCDSASQLSLDVTAGDQYLIEVGGYSGQTGLGVLTISCVGEHGQPPSQADNCQNAKPVGNITDLAFDTTQATFDGPGICMNSPNIWYCYTASCTGSAIVSLCGSSYDTKLAVYDGCQCYPTTARLIGCNDDYCNMQSEIMLDVIAGNQYLIEVGGYHQATGQGVLSISCEGQPGDQRPPNDNCSNANLVGNVTNLAFDTTNATADGPSICMTGPNIWYCYTASCTGSANVSLCGSSYDTKLAVYDGCQCNPTTARLIGCNDDYCNMQSEITFDVTTGSQYLIEVGGYHQAAGQGVLSISCEAGQAPAELDFADAPDSTNNFGRVMTAYYLSFGRTVQANFPTVFNDGRLGPYGPFHRRPRELAYLGNNVSLEAEADIGADQDVINNIDPPSNSANKDGYDDGVIFPLSLPNCGWAGFDYVVNVINPGTELWVNVWFDWNRDGDWDDNSITDTALSCSKGLVSEWAVQNQYLFDLPAGLNQITTPGFLSYHPQGGPEKIWMRITLSEQPWTGGESPNKQGNGGSGPQSGYMYGETEDYFFTPIVPEDECSMCQDLNGDGQINYQDLSILVQQWIAQCM
jgi:hypothetical protein